MHDRGRPFPGVGQAFLLLLLVWTLILVVTLIAQFGLRLGGEESDAAPPALLMIAGNSIAFLVVTLLGWRLTRAPLPVVFPFRRFAFPWLIPLVAACVGGTLLVAEVDGLLRMLPIPEALRELLAEIERSMVAMARNNYVLTVILLVVVAPLTEELFFRGLILQGFLRRFSAPAAILLSAFFFALAHLTPNQLLTAFVGGVFLGWLRVRTGSLWLPVLAHALVNAQAAATLPFLEPSTTAPTADDLLPWWLVAVAVALLVLGVRGLHLDLPRRPASEELPEDQAIL